MTDFFMYFDVKQQKMAHCSEIFVSAIMLKCYDLENKVISIQFSTLS